MTGTERIYYIDYEGCPMECSKEEYEKEQDRLLSQIGDGEIDKSESRHSKYISSV